MPPRAISAISWYFPSIRPGSVNIAESVLPGCAAPEEVLVGLRTCPDLRSLAVTSRLSSFAMARLLAGREDRAGRDPVLHGGQRGLVRHHLVRHGLLHRVVSPDLTRRSTFAPLPCSTRRLIHFWLTIIASNRVGSRAGWRVIAAAGRGTHRRHAPRS